MHIRRISMLAASIWMCAGPVSADTATLFRVFLKDGTAVVSYGEYARVGDRVVFSMPLGAVDPAPAGAKPDLQVVNIPAAAVNWTATSKYTDSARLAHYASTTAEADYAALTGEVAATLNSIVLAKDPQTRLSIAVAARRRLASWPRDHYGYRAADVREMLGLLDESISGLRVAAGSTSFSLELVADAPAGDPVKLMAPPTLSEAIAQAIAVARVTDVPSDRIALLTKVAAVDASAVRGSKSLDESRRWAIKTLKQESRLESKYASLARTTQKTVAERASAADVRGVERALEALDKKDAQLGRQRQNELTALVAQMQEQLDAARRLRLARDQWKERSSAYQAFVRNVNPVIETLTRAEQTFDDIKKLAGSEAEVLLALSDRLAKCQKTLAAMSVPDALKPVHTTLVSSVTLGHTAVKARRQAVVSGELGPAWEASSAAAGSMLLFTRAVEDMEAIVKLPQIR